jgi:periplasmic protein TonB
MAIAQTQEEEKNKRIAAGVSIGVHALIVLFLIYMLAWRAPDPPAPELGIELNFGLDAVGSGDVQTQATPNESKNTEDSKPAPTQPDPLPEPEPVTKPAPAAPSVETPKVVTTTAEAPVTVKEAVKPQPKPQPVKEEAKEPVKQPPKEEVVKKEPEKPKSLYPGNPSNNTGTGKNGSSDKATGNNNGDDANKVGDKGDPNGKVDAKALYGKAGGGAGGSLNMAGWGWGDIPRIKDSSSETGKVVIKVVIGPDGGVESAIVVEKTVSAQIANIYRDAVYRDATFVRTGENRSGTNGATGFITYIITNR